MRVCLGCAFISPTSFFLLFWRKETKSEESGSWIDSLAFSFHSRGRVKTRIFSLPLLIVRRFICSLTYSGSLTGCLCVCLCVPWVISYPFFLFFWVDWSRVSHIAGFAHFNLSTTSPKRREAGAVADSLCNQQVSLRFVLQTSYEINSVSAWSVLTVWPSLPPRLWFWQASRITTSSS